MKSNGWIDKYRSNTLEKVVGHTYTKKELAKRLGENSLRQNILFSGPTGVGKTTFGKILAKTLACTNLNQTKLEKITYPEPCNTCPSCLAVDDEDVGSNLFFFDGSELNKDALNDLRNLCEQESIFSTKKIIFIDEIQNIASGRDSSMQVLLKIIEKDYKGKVFFIMSTMEEKKINKAVIDRFHHSFRLKAIATDELIQHGGAILGNEGLLEGIDFSNLKDEGIDLFLKEGLGAIGSASQGCARRFVNDLETCIFRELYSEKEIVSELGIISESTTFNLIQKLLNGNPQFFKDIHSLGESIESFYNLSYSILSDLAVFNASGFVRLEFQKGNFKQFKNGNKALDLLKAYEKTQGLTKGYFNKSIFLGALAEYHTTYVEYSIAPVNPPSRERKRVRG